jgi:AsmA protein
MRNNDLAMQVPFIRLNGVGQTNLSTLDINYKLDAKVIGSPQFDDGSNLDELNGLTLPVTISGAADDPDIAIDLTSVITGLATKKLQDRLLKKYGGAAPTADPGASEKPLSDRDARKQMLRKGLGGLLK